MNLTCRRTGVNPNASLSSTVGASPNSYAKVILFHVGSTRYRPTSLICNLRSHFTATLTVERRGRLSLLNSIDLLRRTGNVPRLLLWANYSLWGYKLLGRLHTPLSKL